MPAIGCGHQPDECEDRQTRKENVRNGRVGLGPAAEGCASPRSGRVNESGQSGQVMQAMKPAETMEAWYRWEHCQEKTKSSDQRFIAGQRECRGFRNVPSIRSLQTVVLP